MHEELQRQIWAQFGQITISRHSRSGSNMVRKVDNDIRLSRIKKRSSYAERPTDFVSDQSGSSYGIGVSRGTNSEGQSLVGRESKEMIIRKDVTMTVDHG